MKKFIAATALALLLAGAAAASPIDTAHSASAPLSLVVDGQAVLSYAAPFHAGGILYVPARTLLEFYPMQLQWNNTLKQLTLFTSWDKTILTPGSASMKVSYTQTDGDYNETLDAPVLLKAGRVYIAAATLDSLTGAVTELKPGGSRVTVTPGDLSTTVRVPTEPLAVAGNNSKVKLYAALKDGNSYKGFILEANGKKQRFNWTVPRDYSHPPQLFYADVDGDGKPEATVVFTVGTGTSLVAQEVHVVKPEQGKEISVPAADEAARAAVSSSIVLDQKDVLLKLELQGPVPSKVTLRIPDRAEDGLTYFGSKAAIGAVTYYTVENNKLLADTSLMVGMTESVGTLKLEYKAGKTGMELGAIAFEPEDTGEVIVEK
ncbi:stalk domain-containing protein [Paenibacillus piscarius]|uniref:stalk domain-containing protein n=1 Tax=Paenibacillus piscarius TaxID=1089681 RepID=UPI001EE87031|nr:stalk domain-containing protein [Paenibacillus piscarius]